MRRFIKVLTAVVCLTSFAVACSTPKTAPDEAGDETAETDESDEAKDEANKEGSTESDILPVGESPAKGDEDAPVTIVVFSDFQCPFCERGAKTVKELEEKYPDEVRFVFKHNPLPMHKQAPKAHRASIAAHNQGEFWEMHDFLFENQKQFKQNGDDIKGWTTKQADKMGLDVEQFEEDFGSEETKEQIDADLKLSKKVEVQGTPHFFINGERIQGAKPVDEFEEVIDEQLERADQMVDEEDLSRGEVYAAMVEKNLDIEPEDSDEKQRDEDKKPDGVGKDDGPQDAEDGSGAENAADGDDGGDEDRVDLDQLTLEDAPTMGPDDAAVTIVAFAGFQCPYSASGMDRMREAMDEYPYDTRIVFKHYVMSSHEMGKDAAKAAMAAGEQDEFWKMHELLFEHQDDLDREGIFLELAEEIGLDVDQFEDDLEKEKYDEIVERDIKEAEKAGIRKTPGFLINGKRIIGNLPVPRFKNAIAEELEGE